MRVTSSWLPRILGCSLLLGLFGCGEEFLPETYVNELRVLGIRAEPSELHPGESTRLTALTVDPSRPGRSDTRLWLACRPDPLNRNRSPCANTDLLADRGGIDAPAGDGALQLPPGVSLLGLGDEVTYTAPADVFSELSPDDPQRRIGTVAQILMLAVAEEVSPTATPDELRVVLDRVQSGELPSVLTLFRIRVSEQSEVNQNPLLSGLEVDGKPLPEGGTVRVKPHGEVVLRALTPPEATERYVQINREGESEKEEKLNSAWYSTLGRFKEERLVLGTDVEQRFSAPEETEKDPLPESRSGRMWLVIRDSRGGIVWQEFPVYVCDDGAPVPANVTLRQSTGPANGTTLLELEGEGLEGILEVELGGKVLRDTGLLPSGVFSGRVPSLAPGEYPLTLRTRRCDEVQPGLSYTATP